MNQYVCLASAPWQAVPTRTQQLMTRLKGAQVLYFEPPGRRWRKPGRKLRPGLTVYTLPPYPRSRNAISSCSGASGAGRPALFSSSWTATASGNPCSGAPLPRRYTCWST